MDNFNIPTDDGWEPGVLCSTCKDQIVQWNLAAESVPYGRKDWRTLHDIQSSSMNGCQLCSIIAHHLYPVHLPSQVTPSTDPRYVDLTLGRATSSSKDIKHIVSLTLRNPADPEAEDIQTSLFIDTVPFVPYHPPPAGWCVSTGATGIIELAKSWLHDCENNHPECNKFASTPVSTSMPSAPSHLIEITPSSPPTIQLIETAGLQPFPRWVTLSHCWGPHPIFSTTESNVADNLKNIPLSVLPQTFKDAINITAAFGYTHIWIDSLCIIQDSMAHWRQESAIMGNVYRGSIFTIAASGAADGTQGCFRRRNPLGWHTLQMDIPVPGNEGATKSVWFSAHSPESKHDWSSTVSNIYSPTGPATTEPLHSRGWVVQERILSPRTVFFGTQCLTFECVTSTASDVKDKFTDVGATDKKPLWELSIKPPHGKLDDSLQWKEFHGYWWHIIGMYTGCKLTRETDRLVAIGGIIKAMEAITGFENLAGLWRESFLSDLLWHVDNPAKSEKNEGGYRAPTWSWASRQGAVLNSMDLATYKRVWKAAFLDVEVIGKAVNGQIQGGWAKLKGVMRKVNWVKEKDEYFGGWVYRMTWMVKDEGGEEREEGITYIPDTAIGEMKGEFWALWVLHCEAEHSWMNLGLTLEKNGKTNENGEEEWVRLGSFRQYEWAQTKNMLFQGDSVVEREIYVV